MKNYSIGFRDTFIRYISPIIQHIPYSIHIHKHVHTFVVLYHTVSNDVLPHIKHLHPVKTTQAFEKDIDYLLKHYDPFPIDALHQTSEIHKICKRPRFILTFDDGLSQIFTTIYPILKRKGISCICFLNNNFIDNTDMSFRYKASYLIEQIKKHSYPHAVRDILHTPYKNRQNIDTIAQQYGICFENYLKTHTPYLTTPQIQTLLREGFYIGAHSFDHPYFNEIPLHEQVRQSVESTYQICKTFNIHYKFFAFPFTDYGIDNSILETLSRHQIISFGCAGIGKHHTYNHLQRIPLEHNISPKGIIATEIIYYKIKKTIQHI